MAWNKEAITLIEDIEEEMGIELGWYRENAAAVTALGKTCRDISQHVDPWQIDMFYKTYLDNLKKVTKEG